MRGGLFAAVLVLCGDSSACAAERTDASAGALVGLGSLGGGLVGGAAAGAVGFAIGDVSCSNCWGPAIGLLVGGIAGAGVGEFVGTDLTAGAVGRSRRRALLGSAIGLATGAGLEGVARVVDEGDYAFAGVITAGFAIPLGGGLAAGTEKVSATLAPDVRHGYGGILFGGRF